MTTLIRVLMCLFTLALGPSLALADDGWRFQYMSRPSGVIDTKEASDTPFTPSIIKEATKEKGFKWGDLLNFLLATSPIYPTGAQWDPVEEECQGRNIERKVLEARGDFKKITDLLRAYQQKCDDMLVRNNKRGLLVLKDLNNLQYDVFGTPGVALFRLKTPRNESIFGLMARKEGRRPWVIIKCGIFCELNNSSTVRNMLLHLYDEGPFNLIFLNSHTAYTNIVANQRVSFGGLYEGQEMIAVADWLKNLSPFAADVAGIHGMGVSLGGNAVLYAALYNDHNTFRGEKLFNSVVAYCPATNLGPTVDEVFQYDEKGMIFSLWTLRNINRARPDVPDVDATFPAETVPKVEEYPGIIGNLNTRFLARADYRNFLTPFRFETPLTNADEFWRYNNFVSFSSGVQTPTLVWASKNDFVVNNPINAGSLEAKHNSDSGTNIRVLNMNDGNHCAQSVSYGWQSVSNILRAFYLSHTEEAKFKTVEVVAPLNVRLSKLGFDEVVAGYEWTIKAGDDFATLDVQTWRPPENAYRGCGAGYGAVPPHNFKPFTSDRECYQHKTTRVSLATLAAVANADSKALVRPESERAALTVSRYINAHYEIWSTAGSVIGKRILPNQMRVRIYELK